MDMEVVSKDKMDELKKGINYICVIFIKQYTKHNY